MCACLPHTFRIKVFLRRTDLVSPAADNACCCQTLKLPFALGCGGARTRCEHERLDSCAVPCSVLMLCSESQKVTHTARCTASVRFGVPVLMCDSSGTDVCVRCGFSVSCRESCRVVTIPVASFAREFPFAIGAIFPHNCPYGSVSVATSFSAPHT